MMNSDVRISVAVVANAAYVELSDCTVATTSQVNEQVLVDFDERGGIAVLRIDADLPFELSKDRYRVNSGVVDLLRVLQASVGRFLWLPLGQGNAAVLSRVVSA